jgi:hypothetical protein
MQVLRRAVYGMLPKDKLRAQRIRRLLVFPDERHPYEQNLIKYYEDPDLARLTPMEWQRMSAEDMLAQHDALQRARAAALLSKSGKTE